MVRHEASQLFWEEEKEQEKAATSAVTIAASGLSRTVNKRWPGFGGPPSIFCTYVHFFQRQSSVSRQWSLSFDVLRPIQKHWKNFRASIDGKFYVFSELQFWYS